MDNLLHLFLPLVSQSEEAVGPDVARRVGSSVEFGVSAKHVSELASHNGILYMVGDSGTTGVPSTLYTLNTTTGAARTVVNVRNASNLASHNGILYMVNPVTDALYTLNTTTGVATQVGSATKFGVNEEHVSSLVSHNGILYMTGLLFNSHRVASLYTLNTTTGVATRVGSISGLGAFNRTPNSLASHNGILYMIEADSDALYTLNASTATARRVGSADKFGVNEAFPGGLASHNGILYMAGRGQDALFTLPYVPPGPPLTEGRAYVLLNSSGATPAQGFGIDETHIATRPGDMTVHNGKLLMTIRSGVGPGSDANQSALYEVDVNNATVSQVGSATQFGVGELNANCLASFNGKLYMTGASTRVLYELNDTTGVATRVGTANQFAEGWPTAMEAHNGKLYMTGTTRDRLTEINVNDGTSNEFGPQYLGRKPPFEAFDNPVSMMSHNGVLYVSRRTSAALRHLLFTLNADTGSLIAQIGTQSDWDFTYQTGSPRREGEMECMASFNGKVYGAGTWQRRLCEIR